MKKHSLFLLPILFVLGAGALLGCASTQPSDKMEIVCTIWPEYEWVKSIIGDSDKFNVSLLMTNGSDLHSFQPTFGDISKITKSDLFIYVGGESDAWVPGVLQNKINDKLIPLSLTEVLGDKALEEEHKEGMQGEGEEEEAYDEHVWLSLHNAELFVSAIEEKVSSLDPERKDTYSANAQAYLDKLNQLDAEYTHATTNAEAQKTLVFADRFPFLYLTTDYGLDYYAAFSGCSSDSDASMETIIFLANKIDELQLSHIFIIDGSDGRIAETVKQSTKSKDQKIVTLDSMQTTTLGEGKTYLGVMEDNLKVLKEALKS
ncbi:MAG: zinc ABC transporter substrate-binding protein [Bacilli bacterium]|nr:zinc ABC transporter substrate-binding protein [Bacilli bacterium]MBO6285383.1 zinc ABC transporter substrate-binding protein [Bacilli bacterium]